jgi:hypothetical protein
MAVSASGRELAVVQTGATTTQPDVLSIYSVATGQLVHSWTTRYGSRVLPYFAWNIPGPVADWPVLTWVDGDRRIAYLGDPAPAPDARSFTWTMRQLDVTAKGSSLQSDSRVVWTEQVPNSGRDKYAFRGDQRRPVLPAADRPDHLPDLLLPDVDRLVAGAGGRAADAGL